MLLNLLTDGIRNLASSTAICGFGGIGGVVGIAFFI
jgi:hypothetical protein